MAKQMYGNNLQPLNGLFDATTLRLPYIAPFPNLSDCCNEIRLQT